MIYNTTNIHLETRDKLNVIYEEDPFKIFEDVSEKVHSLIVEQGFGTSDHKRIINEVIKGVKLGNSEQAQNTNWHRWGIFRELIRKHPLIKLLSGAEQMHNYDPDSKWVVHAWQKQDISFNATILSELDCERVRALGSISIVNLPRLDISRDAWDKIDSIRDHLTNRDQKLEADKKTAIAREIDRQSRLEENSVRKTVQVYSSKKESMPLIKPIVVQNNPYRSDWYENRQERNCCHCIIS